MIEVGEYVRTKNGDIGKVFKIEGAGQGTRYLGEKLEETIYCIENNDNTENYRYKQTAILKHSKNIIDLIEVGDYVNGEKIKTITNDRHLLLDRNVYLFDKYREIKTILTKEQYEANCYKVKEE